MTPIDENVLVGVTALLLVLVVGTIFGRLHGSDDTRIEPIGDRVACGLLALPLVTVAVSIAFPTVSLAWALAAPTPLALYVVLLAGIDAKWAIAKDHFISTLVFGSFAIYLAMAVAAWMRT